MLDLCQVCAVMFLSVTSGSPQAGCEEKPLFASSYWNSEVCGLWGDHRDGKGIASKFMNWQDPICKKRSHPCILSRDQTELCNAFSPLDVMGERGKVFYLITVYSFRQSISGKRKLFPKYINDMFSFSPFH